LKASGVVAAIRDQQVLLWNTASLVATTLLTSGLGFLFWSLAARRFGPTDVGFAAASISAIGLLAFLCVFGFGTLLVGELPRRTHDQRSLLSTATLVVASSGAIAGVGFALLAPLLSPVFDPLRTPEALVVFAAGVGFTGAGLVLDQGLVGLLRGDLQLLRNLASSVVKLGALGTVVLMAARPMGFDIVTSTVCGALASLVILALVAIVRGHPLRTYRPARAALRGLRRDALSHHVLNVTLQAPTLVLPVVVTILLSPTANAYFYIAFMVAGLVFAGPSTLALTLYAVGSRDLDKLTATVRFTLRLSLLGGLAALVVVMAFGGRILGLFGPGYEVESFEPLLILTAGVFPLIIRSHYVALSRVQALTASSMRLVGPAAALQLGLSVLGALMGGLMWLCLGWVAGACLEAALMVPRVARAALVRPTTGAGSGR
jgi:O-antigen/teichoic acid export membrane protein